ANKPLPQPSQFTPSQISSHSQVSNKIKLIRLHLHSPDFSHIPLPHRHDTHHTSTPNLHCPDLANQSPPSLTPDLESCHNSYQEVVLLISLSKEPLTLSSLGNSIF
ncbi:hypothetical protein NC651_040038, partial [Populus alba x Populus x berolinensis]